MRCACSMRGDRDSPELARFDGSGERSADDVRILGARKRRGASEWSQPFVMADTPGFPDCNPCMIVDPQKRLWLFWPVILANEWHTALFDAGFFGLSWPKKFGGHELPTVFDVILDEEVAAAGAPPRPSLGYLVQGITEHGSDAIQQRFLPGLISGRERWCQGFSEPDAGSDLASLRTTAVRDGDEYVINGHKIWTSYSDVADWCLLLARTDGEVAKHKGLSAFAVPMHQPGIEQRPLRMINGITTEFGQVLFDGARVPADTWLRAVQTCGREVTFFEPSGVPLHRLEPGQSTPYELDEPGEGCVVRLGLVHGQEIGRYCEVGGVWQHCPL